MLSPDTTFLLGADPIYEYDDDDKIAYLEGRMERLLLQLARNARDSTAQQRQMTPTIDSNLMLMTVLCCGIEALGHYLAGRTPARERCPECDQRVDPQGSRADFKEFVNEYLTSYSPIASLLYDEYRCGLAHTFAIRSGGLTEGLDVPFERPADKTLPHRIDFWKFITELDDGVRMYFSDVRSNEGLRAKFLTHWGYANGFWIEHSRRHASTSESEEGRSK